VFEIKNHSSLPVCDGIFSAAPLPRLEKNMEIYGVYFGWYGYTYHNHHFRLITGLPSSNISFGGLNKNKEPEINWNRMMISD
jgi:hypothetical protein